MSEAKLQRLELADDLFPDVMNGKTTDMLRRNEGPFELGYLEFYSASNIGKRAMVLVTGIRHGALDSFAKHYRTTTDLLVLSMKKYYPDIKPSDKVTLIEFMSPAETEALTA